MWVRERHATAETGRWVLSSSGLSSAPPLLGRVSGASRRGLPRPSLDLGTASIARPGTACDLTRRRPSSREPIHTPACWSTARHSAARQARDGRVGRARRPGYQAKPQACPFPPAGSMRLGFAVKAHPSCRLDRRSQDAPQPAQTSVDLMPFRGTQTTAGTLRRAVVGTCGYRPPRLGEHCRERRRAGGMRPISIAKRVPAPSLFPSSSSVTLLTSRAPVHHFLSCAFFIDALQPPVKLIGIHSFYNAHQHVRTPLAPWNPRLSRCR